MASHIKLAYQVEWWLAKHQLLSLGQSSGYMQCSLVEDQRVTTQTSACLCSLSKFALHVSKYVSTSPTQPFIETYGIIGVSITIKVLTICNNVGSHVVTSHIEFAYQLEWIGGCLECQLRSVGQTSGTTGLPVSFNGLVYWDLPGNHVPTINFQWVDHFRSTGFLFTTSWLQQVSLFTPSGQPPVYHLV